MLTNLTERISPRPLGLARILVGVAAVIRGFVAWPVLSKLTEPATLRDPYFGWVSDPTIPAIVALLAIWIVAAAALVLGWRITISGSVLIVAVVVSMALDRQAYSNHLYLMAWLVLLLILAEGDAGINWRRRDRDIVRWPVLMIMLQASIVYGFSALTKINDEFLSGEVLAGVLLGGPVPFPEALRTPAFLSAMAFLVIAVEIFVALFLWSGSLRPYAFVLGLGLHLSIVLLISSTAELTVFAIEMLALYPLFLSSSRLSVTVPTRSWNRRLRAYDVLRIVDSNIDGGDISLDDGGSRTSGAPAHTRILEHLVPWLWVAPVLRLPGVSWAHRRSHRQ